ncbi:OprD family porin [Pseudomonas chlororaphis]|uniref:OprD family porin n=1 Tax=Pseudomonas chlororaphis TaxID=587753 RepID=UPI000D0FFDF6|nr:OprD family porin [Pseudomonas chlororaphis]AVO59323.1 outer membrane porin, OprD family [Pseudomonas chlororaphis subsp. piscium]
MKRLTRHTLLLALGGQSLLALAAEQDHAKGVIEDSQWSLLNRSLYDRRDYRHGSLSNGARNAYKPRAERSDLAEEWAYGLMADYSSGFTQGTLGFGLDAHVYSGWKLDSGGGRAGKARLLGVDNDGHPKDQFSRGGAVAKLRFSSTELRYGEQRVKTPVFGSSDSRLLPETATGWFLTSRELSDTTLYGGRFNESTDRNASSHDQGFVVNYSNGKQGDSFDLIGVRNTSIKGLNASLFSALYEDTWRQQYLGALYNLPLSQGQDLTFDFNLYRTQDTGKALSGSIDNTTWSLMSTYRSGAHSFGLGYQKVDGDTPYDYVTRGAILLSNAVALSDFNAPQEASWQARYDLNMAGYQVPGLTFSALYVRGSGIDGSHMDPRGGYAWLGYGEGGKHWERDLQAKYVVQSGPAKNLAVTLRHAVHRGNQAQAELDADQLRLAIEYPLGGRF